MKKAFSIFCVFIMSFLMLSACDPKISADKADNVKKVTASYTINESFQKPKNNLLKSAELAYTSMSVVASENIDISGLTFDIKLADKSIDNIYCIAYFYDAKNDDTMVQLTKNVKAEIGENYSTLSLNFTTSVSLISSIETDITEESSIIVQFYQDDSDSLNSRIVFSINNISFIETTK